jgi:hypothetical protein
MAKPQPVLEIGIVKEIFSANVVGFCGPSIGRRKYVDDA